jgi:DNA repair protein RadC
MDINNQINKGHRQRLRERFVRNGSCAFAEHELLELLLTYSIPVKDVKLLAKKLLSRFGSLGEVLDAEIAELKNIEGVGAVSAVLIRLVKELNIEYYADKLKNLEILSTPNEVYEFVKNKLAGKRDELFMVIYLNTKNRVVDCEISAEGTVNQAAVYPRKIIRKALENNAAALILAHNHPSGEPEPSKNDISLTNSLKCICDTMNIRLLDHIIVGKLGYFSFNKKKIL